MPPHLIKRPDSPNYYLQDGQISKSLGTPLKRVAEHLLEQYVRGKYQIDGGLTVGEYYDKWIQKKQGNKLLRNSLTYSYKQHFNCYLLTKLRHTPVRAVSVSLLSSFRAELLSRVSLKSARNIIDGSLRAMWQDARRDGLVDSNPFELLEWPTYRLEPPNPFSAAERDQILNYLQASEPFYYPLVRFQFETGCRPSETAALRWSDVDTKTRTISISKSRHRGAENDTKTRASYRRIKVSTDLIIILESIRLPLHTSDSHIFYNKISGNILDANIWARENWHRVCEKAGVPFRKFYCTRHTSITEAIAAGGNPLAIAQYHGTSIKMIQGNYCGALEIEAPAIQLPSTVKRAG